MSGRRPWEDYAWAVGATAACTVVALAIEPRFDLVNIAMLYVLAVVFVALRFSRGAAILTALLCVGTLDFLFVPPSGTFRVDDVQYLLAFAILVAVAVVISRLVASVQRQANARASLEMQAETERIRSALLASISHDLRTPLAVLVGASSTLAESGARMSEGDRTALAASLVTQARELSEHVAKVLEMTRLETQAIRIHRDWAAVPEIVESVLRRLATRLSGHRIVVELPEDLPLIRVDAPLIEQALANLVENAAIHTRPGTLVRVRAHCVAPEMIVSVEDLGERLDREDLEKLFAKFEHAPGEGSGRGVGLGLAICRAIARLHGGRVWAEHVATGGTAFRIALPLDDVPGAPPEAAS
jgi:two-component system sensor histidine kinase KdpD